MRLNMTCATCGNDLVITEKEVAVLGTCPIVDECSPKLMTYALDGQAEKDYNLFSMLFPSKGDRYAEADAWWTLHTRDACKRLNIPSRIVVEGTLLKVWIYADAPNHVSI